MDIHRMLDKYAVEIGSTEHKIKQLRAEKQGIQEELTRTKDARDRERQAMQAELNALSALSYEIKHLAATISDCQAQNDTLKKDIADEQHARKQLAAEADSAKERFISACRRLDEEMQALVAAGQPGAAHEADDGADDADGDVMDTDQGRDQGRAGRQQEVAYEGGRAAGALGAAGAQGLKGGLLEGAAEQEGGRDAETSAGAEGAGGDPEGGEEQLEQEGAGLGDGGDGEGVQDEEGGCGEGASGEVEMPVVDPEVAAEGAMLAAVVTLP